MWTRSKWNDRLQSYFLCEYKPTFVALDKLEVYTFYLSSNLLNVGFPEKGGFNPKFERYDLQSSTQLASRISSSGCPAEYQTSPPSLQPAGRPWAPARLMSLPAARLERRKRSPRSCSPPPLHFLIEFPLLWGKLDTSLRFPAECCCARWSRRRRQMLQGVLLRKRDVFGIDQAFWEVVGGRRRKGKKKKFFFSPLTPVPCNYSCTWRSMEAHMWV